MVRRLAIAGLIAGSAVALALSGAPAAAQTVPPARGAAIEEVFLQLEAPLDEPRGLCIDIPGHRDRVDVSRALVVHTCKWDIWNLDERFDAAALGRGELRMPAYDLCAGAQSPAVTGKVILGDCDRQALRRWTFDNGRLRLAADPGLCLTVGPEPSQLTPGGRRLPSRHVARSLALEARSADADARQIWSRIAPRS